MQFKGPKVNSKRLASLSALGAGALALAAPDAQAGIIHYDVNQTVGFSPSSMASYTITTLPGTAQIKLSRTVDVIGPTGTTSFRVLAQNPAGYARFRHNGAQVFFSTGKTWNNVGGVSGNPLAVAVRLVYGTPLTLGYSVTKQYLLFKFEDSTQGNAMRYGWAHLNLAYDSSHANKPDVTLLDYAFDDSGATITAGDTGASGVPEPSSLALSGLGALVLGAAGIRRWRQKPAA